MMGREPTVGVGKLEVRSIPALSELDLPYVAPEAVHTSVFVSDPRLRVAIRVHAEVIDLSGTARTYNVRFLAFP